jgi:hypothetical protein
MTVTINGTSGITTPADTVTTISSPAATALTIQSASTTAMTIDTSQNVGIGTTSPSSYGKLAVYSASGTNSINSISNGTTGSDIGALISSAGSYSTSFYQAGNGYAQLYGNYATFVLGTSASGYTSFWTSGSERMRIDTSGNLLVGTTSGTTFLTLDSNSSSATRSKMTINGYASGYGYGIIFNPRNDSGPACMVFNNAAGTGVGNISTTSSGTSYITSSDYRLKENVAPMTNGLATISALKPVTYDWKVDGEKGEGFIAHELQEIVPLAVSGEKDAVNEDGSIKPQGVDYSKIVVHLVAAIQELFAKNDALTARIAALEAK